MLNNRQEGPTGKLTVLGEASEYETPKADGPSGNLTVLGEVSEYEESPVGPLSVVGEASEYEQPAEKREKVEMPNNSNLGESLLASLRGEVVDPQTGESYGLEGFREALYVPEGDKSGLTIGTGIDLAQWTPRGLLEAGVSEAVVDKLSPYLGKKDKKYEGESPLTREELEELDSKILEKSLVELREEMPNFESMPQYLQLALVAAKHQYGKGAPKLMEQAKKGDYLGVVVNLLSWTDKTKGSGETIAKKYQAIGKKLVQELIENKG